jgi:hypothetical protein
MNQHAHQTRGTHGSPVPFGGGSTSAHPVRRPGLLAATAVLALAATAVPASATFSGDDDAHRYGRSLFAVDGVSDNDAWAVGLTPGDRAAIWHSEDSGWVRSRHPSSTYSSVFFDVTARAADDVWAVGSQNSQSGIRVGYAQHWNGKRWQVVPADPGLFTSEANAVAALAADDAWIVGDAQESASGNVVALIEHWDGAVWSSVAGAPVGRDCDVSLNGVTTVAKGDVWAVGVQTCDGTQAPLVEHWNGRRWSEVDVPSPRRSTYVVLEDVTAIASDDAWAVGSYARDLQRPGRNLTLHWDGTRWAVVPAPNPGPASCDHALSGVSGSSSRDLWASGTRSCADGVTPQMLHWDGTRWAQVAIPSTGFDSPPGDGLFDVASFSKRSALTVGIAKTSGASIEVGFIERWNGSNWSLQ